MPEKNFETVSGPVRFRLENDVLFHIVMQQSPMAITGLLSAVMGIPVLEIQTVEVLNPIVFGKNVREKEVILDVRLVMNNNRIINIEVQVVKYRYWLNRALFYTTRMISKQQVGKKYSELKPVTHIGILDYSLFPEQPEFFACYEIRNRADGRLLTDKMSFRFLDLTRPDLATEEDRECGLVKWARLFKAETWEEVRSIAVKDPYLEEVAKVMYETTEDLQNELYLEAQERARLDYYSGMDEAYEDGLTEGVAKGREEGIAKGREEGLAAGVDALQKYFMELDSSVSAEEALAKAGNIIRRRQ